MRGRRRARNVTQFMFSLGGSVLGEAKLRAARHSMKTNEQILDDLTAAMADAWLAACNRRVIVPTLVPTKFMVIDQQGARLFGPASGDECVLFVHRAGARDFL